MTFLEFNNQLERLKKVWPNAYPDERAQIIWTEFKHLSEYGFRSLITKLIGEMRVAPTIVELRDNLAVAREAEHRMRRMEETQASSRFWRGDLQSDTYQPKHVKFIVNQIKRRLSGTMGEQEYSEWMRMLDRPADVIAYIDAWYLEQEIIAKENQAALSLSTPSLAARCDPHRHAK